MDEKIFEYSKIVFLILFLILILLILSLSLPLPLYCINILFCCIMIFFLINDEEHLFLISLFYK